MTNPDQKLQFQYFGLVILLVLGTSGCLDPGPIEPWEWCPGQEVLETPGGGLQLNVGERAIYCAIRTSPGPDPASVFSALSRLLLIEGTYEVPDESGSYPVRLPLCVQLSEQGKQPTMGETGQLRVDRRSESWGEILRAWYNQPLYGPEGESWALSGRIDVTYEGTLEPVSINGSYDDITFELQGPTDEWGRLLYGLFSLSSGW